MMAIIGFLLLAVILAVLSFYAALFLLIGGLDLGPAPWPAWVITPPLAAYFWLILIQNSPFTATIN